MFATGARALGICDRCGFTHKLNQLKTEDADGRKTGVRVCPTCWDPRHPQLDLGKYPVYDPQALRDPRPDTGELAESREIREVVMGAKGFGRSGKVRATVT